MLQMEHKDKVSQEAYDAQAEALARANKELDSLKGELQLAQLEKSELEGQLDSLTSTGGGGGSEPSSPRQPVQQLDHRHMPLHSQKQDMGYSREGNSMDMDIDMDIESHSPEKAWSQSTQPRWAWHRLHQRISRFRPWWT